MPDKLRHVKLGLIDDPLTGRVRVSGSPRMEEIDHTSGHTIVYFCHPWYSATSNAA